MKKTELRRRGMAALLALLLLISLCPAALAAEKGTLSIGTLEELADFADRSFPAPLTARATGSTIWN